MPHPTGIIPTIVLGSMRLPELNRSPIYTSRFACLAVHLYHPARRH